MAKPSKPTTGNGNKAPTAITLSNSDVPENLAGSPIGLLTVTDQNKKDLHSFSVDDPRFEVTVVNGQPWLYLRSGVTLDYETSSQLTVRVTATDQGGLSKVESFTIGVTDANDAPIVTTTALSVNENTPEIAWVGAVDPDSSTSGFKNSVSFSLLEGTGDNGFFSIDSSTGALRFVSEAGADYETKNSYTVQVRVADATNPTLFTTRSIEITVTNVNEAPTSVSLDRLEVAENTVGAALGVLSSEDPDRGDKHSYQVFKAAASGGLLLVNGEPALDDRFVVDGGNLRLASGISLDHEATPTVSIIVRSTDTGNLFKDQEATITVTDQNDAPTGSPSITVSTETVELTTTRSLQASDVSNPSTQFFNAENGHIYQFVNVPVNWQTASNSAGQALLAGITGHLVTITSQEEQSFIEAHFPSGMLLSWIAATDLTQEGMWRWTAGPEQGQLLQYTNWDTGSAGAYGPQPDGGTGENYAAMGGSIVSSFYGVDTPFKWVDGPSVGPQQGVGYIIEYSGPVVQVTSTTVTTLSADTASVTDADGLGQFSYQWQWSADGTEWVSIDGANSALFEVTGSEVGKFVRVEVSYQDGGGTIERIDSQPEYMGEPLVNTKPDGLVEFNGHYYQIVESPNVTRVAASLEADQLSFHFTGTEFRGHLATVTSAAEETLIENTIFEAAGNRYYSEEPASYWLAGEYSAGAWEWTSGPEADSSFTYSDWGGIEASQGADEPYLVLNMYGRPDINGVWYSYDSNDTALIRGYVVEYEALM